MAYDVDKFVANAKAATSNSPGTCLATVRTWAGIPSKYPDAATAWAHTHDRHPGDRNPPKGSAVYWTGGSHGYGHIVCGLGGGQIRSTDCTTSGRVSTVGLSWVEQSWGLKYAGWAWDINDVTIPHGGGGGGGKDDDMPLTEDDLQKIASRVNHVLGDYNNKGQVKDGVKESDAERGDQRLNQIENVVRRLEQKVDALSKK